MDVAVKVMVAVVDVGMIMVVVVTFVPWEQMVMMVAMEMKLLAKVTLQVEIMVFNMVMDLVMGHSIIDYLGHRHCLLVFLWTCHKGKEKVNMFVQLPLTLWKEEKCVCHVEMVSEGIKMLLW